MYQVDQPGYGWNRAETKGHRCPSPPHHPLSLPCLTRESMQWCCRLARLLTSTDAARSEIAWIAVSSTAMTTWRCQGSQVQDLNPRRD